MGSAKANLKRKASTIEANVAAAAHFDDNDSDFGDGLLEGVLDGDEDSRDDQTDDDGNDDGASDSDSGDDLRSDDIPTDDEEEEDKLVHTNGQSQDQDADANGDEDDRPNYRIEKDANGGIRYVYDEIDPIYDSDDSDAKGPVNTVCAIDAPAFLAPAVCAIGMVSCWKATPQAMKY
jgi:ribosome biogenesis protein ERB1